MFPTLYRLPLRGSRGFFRAAHSVHTRQLSIFWQPAAAGQTNSRAAIIVKKTTAPLATQRGALKRKLRVILLPCLAAKNSQPKRDLVFIYKGKPAATSQELAQYVTDAIATLRD